MSNNKIMRNALKRTIFKELEEKGFTGTYPHFKKILPDCVELIDFQTNKYGGSFRILVSAVFPDGRVTNLSDLAESVDIDNVDVTYTNERYLLKGIYNGWFYYRDVYISPADFYYDVPEKESDSFSPPEDWKLLQKFDEKTAIAICEEISLQFEDAFEWLSEFEQKNQKKNKSKYTTRKASFKALDLLFKWKK